VRVRRLITLISEEVAVEGYRFRLTGTVPSECRSCKLYRVCIGNLKLGIEYMVVAVRRVKHYCPLLGSYVRVVEVEPQPIELAVEDSMAVQDIVFTYRAKGCRDSSCPAYRLCNNRLIEGTKLKIISVSSEKFSCRYYGLVRKVLCIPVDYLLS